MQEFALIRCREMHVSLVIVESVDTLRDLRLYFWEVFGLSFSSFLIHITKCLDATIRRFDRSINHDDSRCVDGIETSEIFVLDSRRSRRSWTPKLAGS